MDLMNLLDKTVKRNGQVVIDTKDIFGRLAADTISKAILGFHGNSITDGNSNALSMAQNIHEDFSSFSGTMKMMIFIPFWPTLFKIFGFKIFRNSIHDFFEKHVKDEITKRESEKNTDYGDMIQQIINSKQNKSCIDFNDEELVAAQFFVMLGAGWDTASDLMQKCSWELAMNQGVQSDLIREIDEVSMALDGESITYEVLKGLKFLDMVVLETLRKWSAVHVTMRHCTKDTTMNFDGDKSIQFKRGDTIYIPIRMIHHDPQFFENPLEFNPHRFSQENKHKINPAVFIPFGGGPRLCIGMKMLVIKVKLLFFNILRKYKIEACQQTPLIMKFGLSFLPDEEVFVALKSREN